MIDIQPSFIWRQLCSSCCLSVTKCVLVIDCVEVRYDEGWSWRIQPTLTNSAVRPTQMGGFIDDSLQNSGYYCCGSPYFITGEGGRGGTPNPGAAWTNGHAAARQAIPSSVWRAVGERWMLNVPLRLVIDTKLVVYRHHRDLHLFTVAPPSPRLHSQHPLCLWQPCMKWILPHPAAMILISLLPPSLLSSWPAALILSCSKPAS